MLMDHNEKSLRECCALDMDPNFSTFTLLEALGNFLTRQYGLYERIPDVKCMQDVEEECCWRALHLVELDQYEWGVDVQTYNNSRELDLYTAFLQSGDKVMSLDVTFGDCLVTIYQMGKSGPIPIKTAYKMLHFEVDLILGKVNYEAVEKQVLESKPRFIFCDGGTYPYPWEYSRLKEIAKKCNSILVADVTNIFGLMATKDAAADAFMSCEIVTVAIGKGLRGHKTGLIFYRKGPKDGCQGETYNYKETMNYVAFPSPRGRPRNERIIALCTALKEATSPGFKAYSKQAKENALTLGAYLKDRSYTLLSDGTENDVIIWNLRPLGLNGQNFEALCRKCSIEARKVRICMEKKSTTTPCGLRLGTAAMTARGFVQEDFKKTGEFLVEAVGIYRDIEKTFGKAYKSFMNGVEREPRIQALKVKVKGHAGLFPLHRFLLSERKYQN